MPLTQEELQAIATMVQGTVADQLKATSEAVAALTKNVDVIASTMAQDKKNAEAAAAAAEKEKVAKPGDKPADGQPKYLTAEDLLKVLDERDTKSKASAAVQAARQKVIDAKLKGVPKEFLADAPDSADEKALADWADAKVKYVNETLKLSLPDVGGANNDGGETPGERGAEGKPAGFLKMAAGAA